MSGKRENSIVSLFGYDKYGKTVYSEKIPIDDYYDGQHIWDSSDEVKKLGMVKLVGKLYDSDGILTQEFENSYSEKTGEYIGGIATFPQAPPPSAPSDFSFKKFTY